MILGQERLAEVTLAVWRRGGADTLATALPYLAAPDPDAPIGLCTAFRFLIGLTPPEIAALLGLSPRDFGSGAEIFAVAPLPEPAEFTLTGYGAQRPDPAPAPAAEPEGETPPPRPPPPAPPSHPIYPPAFGPPLWSLAALQQARLRRITSVGRDRPLAFETRLLPRHDP